MLGDAALTRSGGKPTLIRLTLNICNDCNLWCSDCQTDSATPHPRKSYMSMERAEEIIEQVLVYYDAVEVVHFFGAEPLMNVQAIHAVGVAFEAAVRMRRLEQMPMFVATTQGTLASTQILETLRRWNVELTINWDGLPEVTTEDQEQPCRGSSVHLAEAQAMRNWSKTCGVLKNIRFGMGSNVRIRPLTLRPVFLCAI